MEVGVYEPELGNEDTKAFCWGLHPVYFIPVGE